MAPATKSKSPPSHRTEDHPPLMTPMSHVKTSPKWSFGRGKQEDKASEDMPSPGQYQPPPPEETSKFASGPKHVFGSGDRSKLSQSKTPGPGQYQHQDHMGAGGAQYSCTPRRERPETDISQKPGPGAHDIPQALGAAAPTAKFGSSQRRQGSSPVSPGPAAYEATHTQTCLTSPKWGLGTADQRPKPLDTGGNKVGPPGPGTYIIPSRLVEGPKYSAAPRREDTARSEGPGPSAYSLGTSVGTGLQWSMRQRYQKGGTDDDPGPGAYQAVQMEQIKEQTPGWRFGTSNREPNGNFNPPGPGTYEPNDPRHPPQRSKFGTSQRPSQAAKGASTPGPGAYEIASDLGHGPKYTVTPRGGTTKTSKTPGPGEYEKDKAVVDQEGKSRTVINIEYGKQREVLSIKKGSVAKEEPKFGFGSAKRQGEIGQGAFTPGPGTYSHGSSLGGNKFSMQSRRQFETKGGRRKFSLQTRSQFESDTPGPGAHGGGFTQFGY